MQSRADATEVEMGVVFSNTIPAANLPQNGDVAQTLVDAANSTINNGTTVSLSGSSVQVICK